MATPPPPPLSTPPLSSPLFPPQLPPTPPPPHVPSSAFPSFSPGFLNAQRKPVSARSKVKRPSTGAGLQAATAVTSPAAQNHINAAHNALLPPPLSPTPVSDKHAAAVSEATRMFKEGDFAGAYKRFSDALDLRPVDAGVLSNRAACAMMLGWLTRALSDCGRASDADPVYAPAYMRAARSHVHLGEVSAAVSAAQSAVSASLATLAGERHREKARILCEAVTSVSARERLHEQLLERSASAADFRAVVDAIRTLQREAPSDPSVKIAIAGASLLSARTLVRALVMLRRPDEAVTAATLALPPALEGRAEALACREVPSRLALELAIELARALWASEDTERAARVLAAVVRTGSGSSAAHEAAATLARNIEAVEKARRRGNDAFSAGQHTDALRFYEAGARVAVAANEGLAAAPTLALLYSNSAAAHSALGDHAKAVIDASDALRAYDVHPKALLRRARAQGELEEWAACVEDLAKVLSWVQAGQVGASKSGRTDVAVGVLEGELRAARRAAADVEVRTRRAAEAKRAAAEEQSRRSWEYEEEDDGDFFGNNWQGGGGGFKGRQQYYAPPPKPRPAPAPAPIDHYKVLGIPEDADDAVIKAAYRKLALKHHPDKGGDTIQFQAVSNANEVLSDPHLRAEHKRELNSFKNSSRGFRRF